MRKLIVLAVLAACGGGGGGSTDIKPTLVLADRSDAEIASLINGAGGTYMFSAETAVDQFSVVVDPCPTIAVSGDTITITGGCTTADGIAIAGSASIQNPRDWSQVQYDFNKDTVYTYEGLTETQSGLTQSFDGIMKISGATYDADVTTTTAGTTMRSDLFYSCDTGSQSCSLSGSGLELGDLGGVLVSGSVRVSGQSATASYTIKGVGTVTANITQTCVSWKLEGTSRASAPCQ